jgi:hypothetical protein
LKQYTDTGKVVPSARKCDNHFFKENWCDAAIRYQGLISNLLGDSWDLINDGTWKIAQARQVHVTSSKSEDVTMPLADEREMLIEADKVVENDKITWEACEFVVLCLEHY